MSKILIYSQEDLDLILELEKQENEELQQENEQLKEVIHKAIDRLYCWGEVLDPEFQKEMLDILSEALK